VGGEDCLRDLAAISVVKQAGGLKVTFPFRGGELPQTFLLTVARLKRGFIVILYAVERILDLLWAQAVSQIRIGGTRSGPLCKDLSYEKFRPVVVWEAA
jgi:hypothetical protein